MLGVMLTECKISYTLYTPGWMLTKCKIKQIEPRKNYYIFPKKIIFYISGWILIKFVIPPYPPGWMLTKSKMKNYRIF